MAKKYVDSDGLLYFWQKIKNLFVADVEFNSSTNYITKTKGGSTSNVVQLPSGVSPSTTTPKMDGTASTGSETAFARGDHIHPTDTSRAASSHTHGNITNSGGLQTSDISIANNDQLVVTDASNSGKVARASVTFDASTATKCLTKKGTWEDFNNYTHPTTTAVAAAAVKVGNDSTGHVVLGNALSASDVGLGDVHSEATKTAASGSGSSAQITITSAANGGSTTTKNIHNWIGVGSASGVCPLDSSGLVDTSYLPSYVDDVIEAYPRTGIQELSAEWLSLQPSPVDPSDPPAPVLTPETGKIYVLMADSTSYETNSQFRWGGTAYVKLADGGLTPITNAEIDTIVAS